MIETQLTSRTAAGPLIEVTAQGLPAELWRPLLEAAPALNPGPVTPVTIVVPHPDDESLGAGGLLHRLAAFGARLTAVFVTDGAAGYPGTSPAQAAALAEARRDEACRALTALGLDQARAIFLNHPDGVVDEIALVERLRPLLIGGGLGLAPWPEDPHPDHQAVGRAAVVAAESAGVTLWQYPIWMRHSLQPDDPIVDVDRLRVLRLSAAEQAAKRAAVETHASQLRSPVAGYGPVLPDHVLELFADGLEPFFLPARAATGSGGA
jgi:LmbE family N-acetylglucosaminyl deacetylase